VRGVQRTFCTEQHSTKKCSFDATPPHALISFCATLNSIHGASQGGKSLRSREPTGATRALASTCLLALCTCNRRTELIRSESDEIM
jgi:hypothetical protein